MENLTAFHPFSLNNRAFSGDTHNDGPKKGREGGGGVNVCEGGSFGCVCVCVSSM